MTAVESKRLVIFAIATYYLPSVIAGAALAFHALMFKRGHCFWTLIKPELKNSSNNLPERL